MAIVNRFTLAGEKWVVYEVPDITTEDGKEGWGTVDIDNNTIYIVKDMKEDFKNKIIIHELMHGILGKYMYFDLYNNEQLVQTLALALREVFKTIKKKIV